MRRAARGDANPLDVVDRALRRAIFGQDPAIDSLLRALNRARYGFSGGHGRRPRATLLFLGPTGVGKSECAKRIAAALHPDGGGFLKVDCSLFSHGHEVSALVGAPPAYVGREQKPLLDPEIIERPNSVLLFDEIEKGQLELWNLLLQIMEDGETTLLNSGRVVSFRQTMVILTTNVGAKEMVDLIERRQAGFAPPQIDADATGRQILGIGLSALQRVFSPEWLNRLDEIVAFRPLMLETLNQVFDRMLSEANAQYREYGIDVEVTPAARERVVRAGFSPKFGARPLRNQLLRDIEAPLADFLASGGIPEGSRVRVDVGSDDEGLAFYYEPDTDLAELAATNRAGREQLASPPATPTPISDAPVSSTALAFGAGSGRWGRRPQRTTG